MSTLHQFIIPLFSIVLFTFLLRKWRCTARKNLPPSPWRLPVIGNLHLLGTYPHRSLQSLSRRYHNELLLLHLGSVPALIVSSPKAAREVMKNQDAIFSSRPKLGIPYRLLYGSRDVAFTAYGEYWRQVRSICVLHLLSTKRVQSFSHVREHETLVLVDKIMLSASSSLVVNLTDLLFTLTTNVICRVAFGRKYLSDNSKYLELKNIMKEFNALLGATNLGDYIPWLSWVNHVNGLNAKIEKVVTRLDEFVEAVIRDHKDNGKKPDHFDLDFIDILLQLQRESLSSSSPIGDDTVKALVMDMFAAGTDTTVVTLEWAMAELIKHPRTMKTIRNEVRRAAGQGKKTIDEEDLKNMPYLKAVIKETMRLHIPVPLLIPHESTQDTKVMGYDISAGTSVIINAWAIARDPTLWESPEEFLPERFLHSEVDFRGQHFEFLPFGAGRRGCPGITFGTAMDELGLAKLVYHFDFALPNGEKEEDLDMSEAAGITVHRKLPMLVVATPYI